MFNDRKKVCLPVFVLLLFTAQVHAQAYKINGKVTGFKNNSQVKLLNDNGDIINKAVLKQGSFVLAGQLRDGPQYVNIIITEGAQEYECEAFAGAGRVTIKGSKAQFPYNLVITGSAEQTKYNAYQYSIKKSNLQREVLSKALSKVKEGDTTTNNKLVRQYNALSRNDDSLTKKAILTHPDAYYAAELMYENRRDLHPDTVLNFTAPCLRLSRKASTESVYG